MQEPDARRLKIWQGLLSTCHRAQSYVRSGSKVSDLPLNQSSSEALKTRRSGQPHDLSTDFLLSVCRIVHTLFISESAAVGGDKEKRGS